MNFNYQPFMPKEQREIPKPLEHPKRDREEWEILEKWRLNDEGKWEVRGETKEEKMDKIEIPKEQIERPNNEEWEKYILRETAYPILKEIKENSPYSDEINKYIRSKEELEIYKNLGLQEGIINDKLVLKDNSIDQNLKDSCGRTNLERMKQGLPPLDKDGNPYNLHHIGQGKDSPLAELPDKTHKENDKILHDKNRPSEIDRSDFAKERAEHWKARAKEIEAQQGAKND